jgi:phytoene/squalene synthetase
MPSHLAATITRSASLQSYLTIRWLADRAYRGDAFALYAYFRWLDDAVDERLGDQEARLAFVARQRDLLDQALAGARSVDLCPEEALLVGLVRGSGAGAGGAGDPAQADGLPLSLRSMLDVMEFDARRRGRPVSQDELDTYTRALAVAVTEALHHCIGHGKGSPHDETRYVAVTGAHVAHMLRDLAEDLVAGYVNVPAELVTDGPLSLEDLHTPVLRAWVRDRVELARSCFATGRDYLARVECARCRLAGHAYIARFEWVLDAVEQDGYRLRTGYPERGTLRGGVTIAADGARSAWSGRSTRSAAGARGHAGARIVSGGAHR